MPSLTIVKCFSKKLKNWQQKRNKIKKQPLSSTKIKLKVSTKKLNLSLYSWNQVFILITIYINPNIATQKKSKSLAQMKELKRMKDAMQKNGINPSSLLSPSEL